MSTIYALLSHSWGGLVIATVVGVLGGLIVRASRWRGGPAVRFAGYAVCGVALLLTAGSAVAIVRISRAERGFPPMGRLVDVGGHRMHILAEGDAKGGPTLVWIAGAHASGLAFYNFQKAMRGETRTILFDRPGTGWSDPGPFPRRTAREAEELATLLEKAGERGPFIVIGHSYGGLLAANFARRHREKTAAVILLDASPPDAFIYPQIFGVATIRQLVSFGRQDALKKLFGIPAAPDGAPRGAPISRIARLQDSLLADVRGALEATEAGPAPGWASSSIFTEFLPDEVNGTAPELVVYDGELDNIPVYVVVPEGDVAGLIGGLPIADSVKKRSLNFFTRSRLRYMQVSNKVELLHPRAGVSHNFVYEDPEFVMRVVRRALAASKS